MIKVEVKLISLVLKDTMSITKGGCRFFPRTIQVSLGNKGRAPEGRWPSSPSQDKPNLYPLGVPPLVSDVLCSVVNEDTSRLT